MSLPWLSTLALLAVLCPGAASAQVQPHAILGGTITDDVGSAVNEPFVRVWRRVDAKGYTIEAELVGDANGAWSLDVAEGTYKVEAGVTAASALPNYSARWYDIEDPVADGYVGDDSDEIIVASEESRLDIDISVAPGGGMDMRVTNQGGTAISGVQARMMRLSDPRVHHNDQTQGSDFNNAHLGKFYMRGMPLSDLGVDNSPYIVVLYDPSGAHGLTLGSELITVTAGADHIAADVALDPFPDDGFEPNAGPGEVGAFSVDGVGLHESPPVPWTGTGVIAGGGDVDWYCWYAEAGDRYLLSTESIVDLGGMPWRNAWLDPMLSLWDVATGTPVLLFEDDDSGPDRQAYIDTLDISAAGEVCAVVTTYGDPEFDGTGQESIGTYDVTIEMGNRRPVVTITEDGLAVPEPPEVLVAFEDLEVVLDVVLDDPEGDTPYAIATFVDADAQPVSGWTFQVVDDTATFTWTPGPLDAAGSPYLLSIEAGDYELSSVTEVLIGVAEANTPPEVPDPFAPEDGSTVDVSLPELAVVNAFDADGDPLAYQFEVYIGGATSGTPFDEGLVDEDPGGITVFEMAFVPDTTEVAWRARSWDGQAYSAWTPGQLFTVETINDPPSVPIPDKPLLGSTVLVRRPSFTVFNGLDPENDPIDVVFQVGLDSTFASPVATSPALRENPGLPDTSWTIDTDLPWGADVYWRARAIDTRGAQSAWSDTMWFQVKENVAPTLPELDAPWGSVCEDLLLSAEPATFTVRNAVDAEGEALTLELRVYDADVPLGGSPLVTAFAPQSAGATTDVPIAGSPFDEDEHYRAEVRADDGTDASAWDRCTFWVDAEDAPTEGLAITAPQQGAELPFNTLTVMAEVDNPTDADAHLPGRSLALAWCLNHDENTCLQDPTEWNQLAFHDGATTAFQVSGLFEDAQWTLTACALDQDGVCAATDSVGFTTAADDRETGTVDEEPGGCGCGGGPLTGWWVLAAAAGLLRRRRGVHR